METTTVPVSPRRGLTPDQKRERDSKFRVDLKDFSNILKGLVQLFTSINILTAALSQAGKGAYLAFPNPDQPGTFIAFNRKHLRSAQAKFARNLLQLKNYLRVSKKKTRDPVDPQSFSGTYTPVFAGDALQYFFNPVNTNGDDLRGQFGPLHPLEAAKTQQPGEALMNKLPRVQQGYLLRNTSTMLFYIYAHAMGLQSTENAQFSRSDDVMMTAFGGEIPATFFTYRNDDGKAVKVLMDIAVKPRDQGGLGLTAPLNTYQLITMLYPPGTHNQKGEDVGFKPERFNTYYYQNIAAANYYSKDALTPDPTIVALLQQEKNFVDKALKDNPNLVRPVNLARAYLGLQDPKIRADMLAEHTIVKNASAEWHLILEPGRKAQRDARKKALDAAKKLEKQRTQGHI